MGLGHQAGIVTLYRILEASQAPDYLEELVGGNLARLKSSNMLSDHVPKRNSPTLIFQPGKFEFDGLWMIPIPREDRHIVTFVFILL